MMNTEKLEMLASILKDNLPFENHSMVIMKNGTYDILSTQIISFLYEKDEVVAIIKLDEYYWQDTIDTFNYQSFDELTTDDCKEIIENEIMHHADKY